MNFSLSNGNYELTYLSSPAGILPPDLLPSEQRKAHKAAGNSRCEGFKAVLLQSQHRLLHTYILLNGIEQEVEYVSQTNPAFQTQMSLIQLCSITLQTANLNSRQSGDLSCSAFLASLMPTFLCFIPPTAPERESISSEANHTFLQQG